MPRKKKRKNRRKAETSAPELTGIALLLVESPAETLDLHGMNARQADWVELSLEDGRALSGAIIFNEFKGTGRLINVDEEFSYDFHVDQVVDVRM